MIAVSATASSMSSERTRSLWVHPRTECQVLQVLTDFWPHELPEERDGRSVRCIMLAIGPVFPRYRRRFRAHRRGTAKGRAQPRIETCSCRLRPARVEGLTAGESGRILPPALAQRTAAALGLPVASCRHQPLPVLRANKKSSAALADPPVEPNSMASVCRRAARPDRGQAAFMRNGGRNATTTQGRIQVDGKGRVRACQRSMEAHQTHGQWTYAGSQQFPRTRGWAFLPLESPLTL